MIHPASPRTDMSMPIASPAGRNGPDTIPVVLSMRDLSLSYEGADGELNPVVHEVSLDLRRGEILGIVGESGSGKSTTALASMGYRSPNVRVGGGEVLLGGTDLLTLDVPRLRTIWGRRIGFVAQQASLALNPSLRIGAQLAAPLKKHMALAGKALHDRQVELLRMVDLPDPEAALRRYSFQFSGGQQQRIAIALAMSCDPEILVMDEPTTGLDATTQARISDLLRALVRERNVAVIYVSHDLGLLHALADRIAVMLDGRIVETGAADDVVVRGRHPYTRALMAAAPRIGTANLPTPAAGASDALPVLRARAVVCTHPGAGEPSVHGIDLEVARGETLGIIGESGSGKSTLLRAIAGLMAPTAGSIDFQGDKLAPLVSKRPVRTRGEIQLIFQNPDSSLNPRQTVRSILTRPIRLFRPDVRRGDETAEIRRLLAAVRLPDSLIDRFPSELSGGQKQRIAIARAFAARPLLLLCDEITSALDVSVQAAILDLLKDLARENGVATVFVSHDLAVVRALAHSTIVMRHGRVVERGETGAVFADPRDPYTRALLEAVHDLPPGEAPHV